MSIEFLLIIPCSIQNCVNYRGSNKIKIATQKSGFTKDITRKIGVQRPRVSAQR